jgi:hypothetical protein
MASNIMDQQTLIQHIEQDALEMLKSHRAYRVLKGTDKTNWINQLGKKYGISRLSDEEAEVFAHMFDFVSANQKNIVRESKIDIDVNAILLESGHAAAAESTSRSIMRYDDDIVVKTIKSVLQDEFKNIRLTKIIGDEGGAFYNATVELALDDDIRNDMEQKRFYIAQAMAHFKGKFFSAVSAILPVINITTGSYAFSKNSTRLTFDFTLCLSHTNDREWVSGVYKGTDETKKEKIAKSQSTLGEASVGKKSLVRPMTLQDAMTRFKNKEISIKVLETAIKACGRSELETFVLKNAGVDVDSLMRKNQAEVDSERAATKAANEKFKDAGAEESEDDTIIL